MEAVTFYLLAGLVLATGIVVIAHPNPLKGAMALVGCFAALAGLYAMLQAHLLAALQLLVYAGGIMVLVVFIIMLLDLGEADFRNPTRGRVLSVVGVVLGLAVAAVFLLPVLRGFGAAEKAPQVVAEYGTVRMVGRSLFTDYVFLFEATSLLLLVAIVGAVVMARKLPARDEAEAQS